MKKQPYQDWSQWVNVGRYMPQEELDKMPQLIGHFMIKIGLPTKEKNITEWVWARRINDRIAEIRSLPYLSSAFKYKDLVEFNPKTNEVGKVIFDGGYVKTQAYTYTGDFANEKGYWESWGYIVEGVKEGIMSVTRKKKNR